MYNEMFETAYCHERVKLHCDCEVEMSDIDAYYDAENRKVKADKSLSCEEKEHALHWASGMPSASPDWSIIVSW